jgi:hypothetical protein
MFESERQVLSAQRKLGFGTRLRYNSVNSSVESDKFVVPRKLYLDGSSAKGGAHLTDPQKLAFCLDGNFRMEVNGREVSISGSRERCLLAILAVSDRKKRSREFFKAMLWPRSADEQASGSLRTVLASLRQNLGDARGLLGSDRTYIWFDERDAPVEIEQEGMAFFEDAPTTLGSQFEDWLQTERARSRNNAVANFPVTPSLRERVCVGILPIASDVDDPHCTLVGDRILSILTEGLRAYGAVDLFDLSAPIIGDDATEDFLHPNPDMLVNLCVNKIGSLAQISVRVHETRSRRLLWNKMIAADQSGPFLFTPDEVIEFANHSMDAILTACFRHQEVERPSMTRPSSMIGVLHCLFGMSGAAQHSVRQFLSNEADLMNSAMANACYALSIANTLGEESAFSADLEQARAHAVRALELNAQNPIVLALVGHVYGFALREFAIGAELTQHARRIAPHWSVAWDFSAMNAVYRGDLTKAAQYSSAAIHLGRYSPYRALFQSSAAITATLSLRHDEAVSIASSVLSSIPNFMAVMRHASVSLTAQGRHEEALLMLHRIKERDPLFCPEGILEPSYPLPSAASREAIVRSFRTLNVTS